MRNPVPKAAWAEGWLRAYIIATSIGVGFFVISDLAIDYIEGAGSASTILDRFLQFCLELVYFAPAITLVLEVACLLPSVAIHWMLGPLGLGASTKWLLMGLLVGIAAGFSFSSLYSHFFALSPSRYYSDLVLMTLGGLLAGWVFGVILKHRSVAVALRHKDLVED